jgi:hypothetical protein
MLTVRQGESGGRIEVCFGTRREAKKIPLSSFQHRLDIDMKTTIKRISPVLSHDNYLVIVDISMFKI